jgi:hypothetical protein
MGGCKAPDFGKLARTRKRSIGRSLLGGRFSGTQRVMPRNFDHDWTSWSCDHKLRAFIGSNMPRDSWTSPHMPRTLVDTADIKSNQSKYDARPSEPLIRCDRCLSPIRGRPNSLGRVGIQFWSWDYIIFRNTLSKISVANEPSSKRARLGQAEPRFWFIKPSPSRAEPAFESERAEPSQYSSARGSASLARWARSNITDVQNA